MKKLNYLFSIAAIAFAMVMVSCSSKHDDPIVPEQPKIQDGDDLAAALVEYSEVINGVPTLTLPAGVKMTMNDALEFDKAVVIKGDPSNPATIVMDEDANFTTSSDLVLEGITFDASAITSDFLVIKASEEKVQKADGTESAYSPLYNIQFNGVKINALSKSLIKNSDRVLFNLINVNDCIIEIIGNNAIFALGNGYPAELNITNSTIWSKEGHQGFLFQSHGKAVDINPDYKTSWNVDKCTFYQIGVGKKVNNTNVFKGKNYLVINLSNSILDDFGSNTGNEVNGWLFGQNSTSPTITYANNTYSKAGEIVAGWTDETKSGSDQTGTAGTIAPNFADAANGDFTQSGIKAGDPRWIK